MEGAVAKATLPGNRLAQTLLYLAWTQLNTDRLDEAHATLERSRTEIERSGHVGLLLEHHWFLAQLHFLTGRWDDALAEAATSRQLTEETGAGSVRFVLSSDPSPLIHLHRGDIPAARNTLAAIDLDPSFHASTATGMAWMEPTRALVQEGAGQPEAAFRSFEAWHKTVLGRTFLPDYRGVARSVVRLGRTHRKEGWLDQIVDEAAEAARRASEVPSVTGTALLLQGMIQDDSEALMESVEAFRVSPRLFDRADACAEAALDLLSRGHDKEGRTLLDEAFELYRESGAQRAEDALAGEARSFGIRRGARGRRQRPVSGWSALTATEERIAGLVAEGMTNGEIGDRLYIGRGTVATHLRSVFRKLAVTSRAELAAEVTRRLS